MPFANEYVDNVLRQNFEDFCKLFLEDLLNIHYAHLCMLDRSGILERDVSRRLLQGLDAIAAKQLAGVVYDGSFEDVFFLVERLLEQEVGADVAGRLHTARSRNDIDVTLYRLRWRLEFTQMAEDLCDLRESLLELCEREIETVIPLYTHSQAAQPSTVAHYFHAWIEHLERDSRRLRSAVEAMNYSPLGACAITGTGFPIDRTLTADLLAFDGPTGNTYASIGSADYLLEGISAAMTMLTMLGRVLQDLLLWSTNELHYLQLGDDFVQVSSIMPQKRNPVSLEHARALASRALGEATAVFQVLHNTPFGDIVDIEDDLQPVVLRAVGDSRRILKLLAATLSSATFDQQTLERKARRNWITLTELADTLVRDHRVSFRQAHRICSRLVKAVDEDGRSLVDGLRESALETLGRPLDYTSDQLDSILSPAEFVRRRVTLGGPSPPVMIQALADSRDRLEADRDWATRTVRRFAEYPARLRATVHKELAGSK